MTNYEALYIALYCVHSNAYLNRKYKGIKNKLTDIEMKTCIGRPCKSCELNAYNRMGSKGCLSVRLKRYIR